MKTQNMKLKNIKIIIPQGVLNSIYNECNKYEKDETGGRILGFYNLSKNKLEISVSGEIGPGPKSTRNPVSFFQDGEFQEKIFRMLESKDPNIEHLGNWHTHHGNGYPTLSSGDITTYTKIVNHPNHNIDFFYALLVVSKNHINSNRPPYEIKHFIFFRNSSSFLEIPESNIVITNALPIWIGENNGETENDQVEVSNKEKINQIRYYDQLNIKNLYPHLKPYYSEKLNSVYWKGKIALLNNFDVEIMAQEISSEQSLCYSILFIKADFITSEFGEKFGKNLFESVTQAVVTLEREINNFLIKN